MLNNNNPTPGSICRLNCRINMAIYEEKNTANPEKRLGWVRDGDYLLVAEYYYENSSSAGWAKVLFKDIIGYCFIYRANMFIPVNPEEVLAT